MTEIDGTLDPFVEAEIKEHHAENRARNSHDCNHHLRYVNLWTGIIDLRTRQPCAQSHVVLKGPPRALNPATRRASMERASVYGFRHVTANIVHCRS